MAAVVAFPPPPTVARPSTSYECSDRFQRQFARYPGFLGVDTTLASPGCPEIPPAPVSASAVLALDRESGSHQAVAVGPGPDTFRRYSVAVATANRIGLRQVTLKTLAFLAPASKPTSGQQRKDMLSLSHSAYPVDSNAQSLSPPSAVPHHLDALLHYSAHFNIMSSHDDLSPPVTTSPVQSPTSRPQQMAHAPTSSPANGCKQVAAPTVLPLSDLMSPCFYHEGLDSAVDVAQILDVASRADDGLSHSRLVQTATAVRQLGKLLQRRPLRRPLRNVMIVTKARDNQLVYLTRELTLWLLCAPRYGSNRGVTVYVDAKLRTSRRFDASAIVAEDPRFADMLRYWTPDLCWTKPETFDLVLTLGGDGTVLFTSWLFQRVVPPVLPFALGSLGFLTTFEYSHYCDQLNRLMGSEGMRINLRMRFTCTVYRGAQNVETERFEVLNELVIDRGPSAYVSNLELYGDDELLTVVQADGCIFSTPTGSTAYSLSAGGSLVHPEIPCVLLTPICPHTLSFRPMVLSDTMLLRVSIPRNSRATAYCAFDGKGRIELRQGDCVTISASKYPFPTVTRTDTEWFDSVSRTLRWNTRAAAQKPFDPSDCTRDPATLLCPEEDEPMADPEPQWDIDFDTDSACYASEDGSVAPTPLRKMSQMC